MNNKDNTKQVKKVIRVFFVWSETKEAEWLNKMSRDGWHLIKVSVFFYIFEKGEPENFVYQFDFRLGSSEDEEEYLEIFRSAGWELVNQFGAWYYFRKPWREGEQNRIYSDRESLKKKYMTILFFLFLVGLPLFINLFIFQDRGGLSRFYSWFWPVNTFFFVLWLFAVVRIFIYMKRVTRKPE